MTMNRNEDKLIENAEYGVDSRYKSLWKNQ